MAQAIRSPALDVVASVVGLLGQSEVALGLALGLAVARLRVSRRDAIVPLFIVATIVIETLLKVIVPQAPPPHERSRTVQLLPFVFVPFAQSFPSGHLARTAFLLRISRPISTWGLAIGCVVMAATRVYLGEHWLSDALGGALLGIGVASIASAVTRKAEPPHSSSPSLRSP